MFVQPSGMNLFLFCDCTSQIWFEEKQLCFNCLSFASSAFILLSGLADLGANLNLHIFLNAEI